MINTYQQVAESLVALLSDNDHKVVALRGKWGTGKTHLWKSMARGGIIGGKPPVYISLFGVRSIKELKIRILQSISLSDQAGFRKIVETGGGIVAGLMKRFAGYSAEDGMILWLSSFVGGRLIVIDDLERKHSSLGTDEVMGFLNEYAEGHGARFLVLLNLEKLSDELWSTLHEKVIDGEVVLDPTPVEAFDVAANGCIDDYIPHARQACEKIKLTNIRVIRRVLRILKKIAALLVPPHNAYDRWVPSVVLLVSSHFRAADNVPPFDYIKKYSSFESGFREVIEEVEEEKTKKWAQLMEDLEINSINEFELLVQDYLCSGLLKSDELRNILEKYQKEYVQGDLYSKRRELFIAYWWDPTLSADDLKEKAKEIINHVDILSPSEVSEIVGVLVRFDEPDLAREAVNKWEAGLASRPEFSNITRTNLINDFGDLHHSVQAALQSKIPGLNRKLTLAQAVHNIVYGTIGSEEIAVLERATVSDYIGTIKSIKLIELKNFLEEHVKWHGGQMEEEYFPNAVKNFVHACQGICIADPSSRLTSMIKRTFEVRGKSALL